MGTSVHKDDPNERREVSGYVTRRKSYVADGNVHHLVHVALHRLEVVLAAALDDTAGDIPLQLEAVA